MNYGNLSIGFIGAGRVSVTLGRCFYEKKLPVSGYFSKTYEHAAKAGNFTHSRAFGTVEELAGNSDIIFITVPDGEIYNIYKDLKKCDIRNKILCHCSGAMSAKVFEDIESTGAYGFSVHPAYAFGDKWNSYKELGSAFFTVEGNREKMPVITGILNILGNPYQVITAENKYKYHASLTMASNCVAALYNIAENLLGDCGFSDETAQSVLNPLFLNNAKNICQIGCKNALTGAVDRNDITTVHEHLSVLDDDTLAVYRLLSGELIKIAKQKYPNRDYSDLENLLGS